LTELLATSGLVFLRQGSANYGSARSLLMTTDIGASVICDGTSFTAWVVNTRTGVPMGNVQFRMREVSYDKARLPRELLLGFACCVSTRAGWSLAGAS